jgi:ribonuclease P protein component
VRWFASLRRAGDFARVRRRGRRAALPTLSAFGVPRPSGPLRVGITASKAVGPAVVRNRVRRRVQGALDALRPVPGAGAAADLVIVLRPEAAGASYERLAADVAAALAGLTRAGA